MRGEDHWCGSPGLAMLSLDLKRGAFNSVSGLSYFFSRRFDDVPGSEHLGSAFISGGSREDCALGPGGGGPKARQVAESWPAGFPKRISIVYN